MKHEHEWKNTLYRASPLTMGASGKGRTIPWERVCLTCGKEQSRSTDWVNRRTVWQEKGSLK